ncbi:MAG: DUF998 domain-containing protein [Thermoplasmatales archaeon]
MPKAVSRRSLNVAGILLFVATVQFVVMLFITEAMYAGYSISNNYISDLGVGSTGVLFNTSISALGIAVVVDSFFVYRGFGSPVFASLIALTGLGALLVGVFNENYGTIHSYVSYFTFIVGPLTAIYAYRFESGAMAYASIILGLISYFAIVIFLLYHNPPVIGRGGWERLVVYPFLLWGVGFGGYLAGLSDKR